jgi:hypothetical protein
MTVMLERLADDLAVAPEELERRSLLAYIEREQRLTVLDIADLQDRYGVRTRQELAQRIEQGLVYTHPAWEELIEWEHLETYAQRLRSWESELVRADA